MWFDQNSVVFMKMYVNTKNYVEYTLKKIWNLEQKNTKLVLGNLL